MAAGGRNFEVNTLVSAGLTCFFAGGLYGWSALAAPLRQAFHITSAGTGLAFSLAIVSFTLSVVVVPRVTCGRASLRQLTVLASAGALFLYLAVNSSAYLPFLLWFSGGFGAASGAIYSVALTIAAHSCNHRVATPVIVAAFGAGGAVFGPLWRYLADAGWGLNGLSILSAGLLAASIIAWFPKPTVRQTESGSATTTAPTRNPSDRKYMALIWLIFLAGSFSGLMVLGMAALVMDASQVSLRMAGVTLAGIAVFNTCGRLSVAWVSRMIGLRGCLLLSGSTTAAGLLLVLASAENASALCIGLVMVAAGYGVTAATAPALTRHFFPPNEFQRRFAVIFTAWGVAGFSAPWLAGASFDLSGDFKLAVVSGMIAVTVFSATSFKLGPALRDSPDHKETGLS